MGMLWWRTSAVLDNMWVSRVSAVSEWDHFVALIFKKNKHPRVGKNPDCGQKLGKNSKCQSYFNVAAFRTLESNVLNPWPRRVDLRSHRRGLCPLTRASCKGSRYLCPEVPGCWGKWPAPLGEDFPRPSTSTPPPAQRWQSEKILTRLVRTTQIFILVNRNVSKTWKTFKNLSRWQINLSDF